jgi:CheY-like chemotaxis protein
VPKSPGGNGSSKGRVLLVEDHVDSARLLARLLRYDGYDAEVAETAADAIRAGNERRFDVLLTDLSLPDGTGVDVLRALRASRTNPAMPAIAITGHGMPEDRTRTRHEGFCCHLTKPVDLEQLQAALQRALDRNSDGPASTNDGLQR